MAATPQEIFSKTTTQVINGKLVNHQVFGDNFIGADRIQTLMPGVRYLVEGTTGEIDPVTGEPIKLSRVTDKLVKFPASSYTSQVQLQDVAPNSIVNWTIWELPPEPLPKA